MDFRKFKPRPIKLSLSELVQAGQLEPGRELPLVLTPAQPGVRLAAWAAQCAELIEGHLRRSGALLFRGFGINTPELFEEVVRAVTPRLLAYTERSTPRTSVGAEIYTATEYPADRHIPLHNENSYSHAFPRRLWFCCLQPAEGGGETPLADSREVLRRLKPQTRDRFVGRGVMYVRNYGQGIDLDWQTVFQTDSPRAVEDYCRGAGIEFEWRGGGRLRTRQVRPAIQVAPETGEPVWFNQAHLFHVSSLDEGVREDLLRTTAEGDLTRHAYYGDGSPIAVETLEEIRGAYRACAVSFPWQRGDVLLVNNLLTAHGRNPYRGERRVLVAMADGELSAPAGPVAPA
ncbi:MAG TPA: TauD/TfdA family dioxygenase [Pyrinomonadaceae bacterium]|nr:TauD/TfdA family dioxygenase [Pyrinomonadaceae bacterium]